MHVTSQISSFIDEAVEKGDSVLVHSLEGIGRCIACVTAYLMFRHRWSFEKGLDFLCNKRPDAAPNPGFVQQVLIPVDYEHFCSETTGILEETVDTFLWTNSLCILVCEGGDERTTTRVLLPLDATRTARSWPWATIASTEAWKE